MTNLSPSHRYRRLARWSCLVLWACAAVASHLPPQRLPRLGTGLATALHGVGYFVLSSALWLTLRLHAQSRNRRLALLLAVPAYAVMEELTQPLLGRCTSTADWLADVLGTVAAVAVLEVLNGILARRLSRDDGRV